MRLPLGLRRIETVAGPAGAVTGLPLAPREASLRDEQRLRRLVERHFSDVWRAMRRLGVPAEAVDDATQEVFIVAARRLGSIEPGRERQFLYGTALRIAANARRARANHERVFDAAPLVESRAELPGPDALLDTKRRRMLLDEALDRMPDDLRTVLVLVELEGLSAPDIAELVGIPPGTVASRLRRARQRFYEEAARLRRQHESGGEP